MTNTNPIIALHAPVEISAADGASKPARFTTTFYTGGELEIEGWDHPVVVDLTGLDVGNVLVANLDHDRTKRVGNFDVLNDGRQLVAEGTATAATAARDEVVNSAKAGYKWQSSLEVKPKKVEFVKAGASAEVNGQTFKGPVYVARKGVLKGFGFVSHGADDNTTVAIAANARRGSAMTFENWMSRLGIDTSLMTGEQLANVHATYQGRNDATAEDHAAVLPMIQAADSDPTKVEERRMAQIEAATRGKWGRYQDQINELKATAIEGELSIDELLDGVRKIAATKHRRSIPLASSRGIAMGIRNMSAPVIEAAFAQAIGLPKLEDDFDERTLQAAHDQFGGCVSLQQMLLTAAAQNGFSAPPGTRVTNGNLRDVLAHAMPPIHAAGFSTLSLPGILSNVANKSLLKGWMEGDTTWRQVAAIKPVTDFKQATSYRLLDTLEYEQVAKDGELKHGDVSEESYTRQAATYGRMFSISREDIINDDLGAFADLRMKIGRAALQKFNDVFWTAFLNNGTFFTSGNSNYIEGSTSNLGTDGVGLQAGVLAFRTMTSSDGKQLDGEPTVLLVPPQLEFNARRLWQSTNMVATGDTDAQIASANVFGGLYRPVIQPRLSNSAFTGYSTTAWYLLRNPAEGAVVCVSFLFGRQAPTVETAEASFNTLGIQMRGYHDFGVDLTVDYPAGVRSKGAA